MHRVEVYDDTGIHYFTLSGGSLTPVELFSAPYIMAGEQPFNWEHIPLIAFKYNADETPLLTRCRSMQDGLNAIESQWQDQMQEDPRNTIMVLVNYDGENLLTAFEVQKGFSLGFDVAQVDETRVRKLLDKPWTADRQTFSDRIWKSKAQLLDSVGSELTQMCILGKAPDDAIANIAKRMNVAKSQAGRLVMTENAYFGSAAQQQCYKDLDVEQYQIVATLDSRTSDICRHLDGKVFDMADYEPGVTAPPFHVYCRSCTAPYFADNDENGMRAARDGDGKTYYVPADMTYEEWKNRFTRAEETQWVTKKKTSNEYSVQRSVVNSKKFHDRFDGASKHHAVDEALYQDALKMLEHRDGTELEDLTAFDARTGKLIAKNDTSTRSGATGFSYEQYQATLDCPNGVVLLHNHPNSSRPSATDIKTLFENEQVERSVIACHNGEVHILSNPDRGVDIARAYEQWYNQYKEDYGDNELARIRATDKLYDTGWFEYQKRG